MIEPASGRQETVLVVEDDRGLRDLLVAELDDLGLAVEATASAEEAIGRLERLRPSLIVSDLRLPGGDGIAILEHLTALDPRPRPGFIVITAFGSISQAVDALKKGADDFLTKPLDLDHLRLRVEKLLEVQHLRRELDHERHRGALPFHGMLGRSQRMQELFANVRRVARGRGAVLIAGESGVGKELVARAIHNESERSDGPFVPVNCAGIPANLIESELFGHEPGSFTGATRSRTGLFAEAAGGTILLDEVAELEAALQAKLLRVLQGGAVRRLGSDREKQLDVRVLCATNRDLEEEVAEGRFREDLFYRLTTFILEVPPLRERGDDLEPLIAHFLARFARDTDSPVEELSPEVMATLRAYRFPGNVRELQSIIEHAVTFASASTVGLRDLPARVQQPAPTRSHGTELPPALLAGGDLLTLAELTRRYVHQVLEMTAGNKRRAAALLGISRPTLYRYLKLDPS
jgi:DNA-binding NtrC family response regulator